VFSLATAAYAALLTCGCFWRTIDDLFALNYEPTIDLHFHDIAMLLKVIHQLRDHGNAVVVIEHNLDVIKTADWIIDMGPAGTADGGTLVAKGTPEDVAANPNSYTGKYLKERCCKRFF
jgi:excinuclease UvrABC ATPase subunit